MIICINYRTNGDRYIALVDYNSARYDKYDLALAKAYTEQYDEVYVIPFIPTKELINEVVLNGCRM